ncbi:MAG: CHAT domain-containing protein [Haliscomenobacter sp.]|nr:CHAT domain-containing protein [Haliscomenobacter sp.]MBK9492835.1 CHAT domain-containing protein [Haliscomenobacter sp.]
MGSLPCRKGNVVKKAARYHEADSTLNEGLKLLTQQRKNSIFIQEVYRFLVVNAAGRLDTMQESKVEAEKLYEKYRAALKVHLKKAGQQEIYVLSDDLNAYYSYFRLDKKEDCFNASKEVLNKINPQVPAFHYYREAANVFISETELMNNNYQEALVYQLESFKSDINPNIAHEIKSWSDAMKPRYSSLGTNSFFTLRNAGQIYLSKYKEGKEINDLIIAVRLFEVSDSLMSLGLTMSEGGVLSYHQEIGNAAYGFALEAVHLAYTLANQYPRLLNKDKILDLAFRFIERQKTYILSREDLPANDWTAYFTTKIKKTAADIAKLNDGYSNIDATLGLVKANFEYDSLLNILSRKATDRFNQNIQTVQKIRFDLKEDEVLLQYKVFDQLTYVFGLSRKTVFFDTVGATSKLRVLVTQFSKLVSSKIDHFDYEGMNKAKMVYDLLLKRVLAKSPAQKNLTLIIIPDRFLTDVPFDALPTRLDSTINDWVKVHYLLKKYYVVYAPSWKIWQTNRYLQLANSKYPAAFFSYTIQNNPASNLALAGAKIEKEALANFARTTPYTSYYCTSALFRKNATRFRILHFCLHGKSDLSKLDANELYFKTTRDNMYDPLNGDQIANLELKGKWAIISACETGIGQTNAEGTYSLSRAFLQAGCAFTISSLWKINNDSSSQILAGFYQNLQDEKKPWKALTKAKRDYIKSMDNQPPYYWSGLIPTI